MAASSPGEDSRRAAADLLDRVGGLCGELRRLGVPVSLNETVDALHAVALVPLWEREALRRSLASTLTKTRDHWRSFDTVFDIYFSPGARAEQPGSTVAAYLADLPDADLRELLVDALRRDDALLLDLLAVEFVRRYAGIDPGRPAGTTYYMFKTVKAINPDAVLDVLVRTDTNGQAPDDVGALVRRVRRAQREQQLLRFQQQVEAEVRRQLVHHRGRDAVAGTLRELLPAFRDLMLASPTDLETIAESIAPLARRLALGLTARSRHTTSRRLDFRRSYRSSLSYGGAPVRLAYRAGRPISPQVLVLADVSGSVATFSAFALQLLFAVSRHLRRIRTYVFTDATLDVTEHLRTASSVAEAARNIAAAVSAERLEGHSDYGEALTGFWHLARGVTTPDSVLLVIGDARANYHRSGSDTLARLRRGVSRVMWLNPEPRSRWDTGDSVMREFARHCDDVFECRNLRQLSEIVTRLG